MKKVLIIQRIVPEYRITFFNLLKLELEKENIELSLIYGDKSSTYKSGAFFYELEWGKLIINKIIKIGNLQLCWQPITRFLKDKDLIIVEQSNKLILNYFIIVARHFWKNKLGLWGHGRNLQAQPNSWANKFGLYFITKCDWWFAYTNSVKNFLIKSKYPDNNITVVQNAIDTLSLQKQFSEVTNRDTEELKHQLGITGSKTAIFCGGMYPEKRIKFILESCFKIKNDIPEFEMIFIGAGVDSDMVKKAGDTHNWIHYVGPKNGIERVKYFSLASVQLMPGLVGLGVLDSFALQTPIITTKYEYHSPEVEYLVNGQNGIITENTLEGYSDTIIKMFKNNEYLDLIEGCKISAQKYTIEKMVANFKEGILQCLGTRPIMS